MESRTGIVWTQLCWTAANRGFLDQSGIHRVASGAYRILGFSVLTLRGSSIVYFLAATAVILVFLVRLTRAGLVRAPLAFVIAAVYLWEPTAMLRSVWAETIR